MRRPAVCRKWSEAEGLNMKSLAIPGILQKLEIEKPSCTGASGVSGKKSGRL
jgi:hypothetical protein